MKTITHILAGVITVTAAFFTSPAGQVTIHQYPILVPVLAGIGAIGALYHSPKVGQ